MFFAALGGLPRLVLYGLVAGLLAGVGVIVGRLLRRGGVRYSGLVLLAAIVATPAVTEGLLAPRIEDALVNRALPMMVDDVTRLVHIDMGNKRFTHHYELLGGAVPAGTGANDLKALKLPQLCRQLRAAFSAGALETAEYRYRIDGKELAFTVEPGECGHVTRT